MCTYVVCKHDTLEILLLILTLAARSRGKILPIETGIAQSIRYGTSPVPIMDTAAGTVDTGSTLILLATGTSFYWIWVLYTRVNHLNHPLFVDAFGPYRRATGAVVELTTELLRITLAQYSNLKSVFFATGDRTFELTANAQIWPRALNKLVGGERGHIYLVVNDIEWTAGTGPNFMIGYTFVERFHSVFDTGRHRIGLATTQFTTAKYN
jgi:cathepsin E